MTYYIYFDTEIINDLTTQNKKKYPKNIFILKTDSSGEIEEAKAVSYSKETLTLDLKRTGTNRWSETNSTNENLIMIEHFNNLVQKGYLIDSIKCIKTNPNNLETYKVCLSKANS